MGIRASKGEDLNREGNKHAAGRSPGAAAAGADPSQAYVVPGEVGGVRSSGGVPLNMGGQVGQTPPSSFVVGSPATRLGYVAEHSASGSAGGASADGDMDEAGEYGEEVGVAYRAAQGGVPTMIPPASGGGHHLSQQTAPQFMQTPVANHTASVPLSMPTGGTVRSPGEHAFSPGSARAGTSLGSSFSPAPVADSPIVQERSKVPVVFSWKHGGREVYLTGSFNNWETRLPLNLSHGDFTIIQELPPGEHEFRYIVDGIYQTDPALPTATHADGQAVNLTNVQLPDPAQSVASAKRLQASPVGSYSDSVLDSNGLQQQIAQHARASGSSPTPAQLREPPALPPHLHRALLNTAPLSDRDPSLLPLPHHVMLNHFYALPRDEESVLVLGITRRWRGENTQKFVTTVFYTPSPVGPAVLT